MVESGTVLEVVVDGGSVLVVVGGTVVGVVGGAVGGVVVVRLTAVVLVTAAIAPGRLDVVAASVVAQARG